jgi:CBS domain containing-hemolysin-like protein
MECEPGQKIYMDNNSLLTLLFVFLGLDALFSLARISLSNARLPYLIEHNEQKPAAVDRTLQLLEHPRLRVSLRLALVFTHFVLAGTIWALLVNTFQIFTAPLWLVLAMLLAAVFVLLVEVGLDRLVRQQPEVWALRLTWLGELVELIFRPLAIPLAAVLGPLAFQRPQVTEDELKNWVEAEQPASTLEKGERKMIASIFDFSDRLVREIMIPRIDVFALDASISLPEAIEKVVQSGHSRLPVYEETIDNIQGLLYAKDILRVNPADQARIAISSLLRPAYFVPEAKKVDELLREMQSRRVHIAIVVDEYGGMAGLVTLEDIVEEIVGEIRDEYDQGEELLYQQLSPDEYLFQGRIDIDDFNEILDTHLTREVADTLAGYIYGEVGRVPTDGEQIEVEGWQLTVEQVIGQRISKVRAQRLIEFDEEEGDKDGSER